MYDSPLYLKGKCNMSHELNQFTKDALRTEAQVETVSVNLELLINTLELFTAAGNMLDQIKKHVFYGSNYNIEKYNNTMVGLAHQAKYNVEKLEQLPLRLVNDFKEEEININPRIFHALTGVATESTELIEALIIQLRTGELDLVNASEEIFDILWYIAIFMDQSGNKWDQTISTGINKLKKRFPDKFNQHDAEQRDLESEREVLETGFSQTQDDEPCYCSL